MRMAAAFRLQFEGNVNGGVLWSATAHRYGLGVIVIECEEEAGGLLQALENDTEIFDFSEGPEDATYYYVV